MSAYPIRDELVPESCFVRGGFHLRRDPLPAEEIADAILGRGERAGSLAEIGLLSIRGKGDDAK